MFREGSFYFVDETDICECKLDASNKLSKRLLTERRRGLITMNGSPFIQFLDSNTITLHDVRTNFSKVFPLNNNHIHFFDSNMDILPSLEEFKIQQQKQRDILAKLSKHCNYYPLKGALALVIERSFLHIFRGCTVQLYTLRNCDEVLDRFYPGERVHEVCQKRDYMMVFSQTSLHLLRHCIHDDKIVPLRSFSYPSTEFSLWAPISSLAVTVDWVLMQRGHGEAIACLTPTKTETLSCFSKQDEIPRRGVVCLLPHCVYYVSGMGIEDDFVEKLVRRDYSPK